MLKALALIPAILVACILGCLGQEAGSLSDQQAFAAAEKAFTRGNWNPDIFEARPNTRRVRTLDEIPLDSSQQELRRELLERFGTGPLTIVAYTRRPPTLKTNGGEAYCTLYFLVFSANKVAVIDSRAASRPADMLPKKSP